MGRFGALLLASAMLGFLPTVASAAPSSDVEVQELGGFTVPALVTGDPSDTELLFRRIDIAPGGSTGWHWHSGPVYAVVASGTLTRILHDCSEVTSAMGSIVEEVVGEDELHTGVNMGSEPLVLYVAYLVSEDQPVAHVATDPGCGRG